MYLAYVPQSAYAAKYHDADRFRYTTKISLVFLPCFYFLKIFYYLLSHISYFISLAPFLQY